MYMYRYIVICVLLCFVLLNGGCAPQEKPAIIIGTINTSAEEFESAFNKSIFARSPTPEVRQGFIDTYIDRKLILKEAEKQGLDKDKDFLASVQLFWEQSLLKLVLNAKIKELSANGREFQNTTVTVFLPQRAQRYTEEKLQAKKSYPQRLLRH